MFVFIVAFDCYIIICMRKQINYVFRACIDAKENLYK